jgi:anti-sigma regulatory factor (Ser/Thr protein kinase)
MIFPLPDGSGQRGSQRVVLAACRKALQQHPGLSRDQGLRERLVLAVNEIAANILRHSRPPATVMRIDFVTDKTGEYCVIADDGGSFGPFEAYWQRVKHDPALRMIDGPHIGLGIIRSLWPDASYHAKMRQDPWNRFMLPLHPVVKDVPEYFQSVTSS